MCNSIHSSIYFPLNLMNKLPLENSYLVKMLLILSCLIYRYLLLLYLSPFCYLFTCISSLFSCSLWCLILIFSCINILYSFVLYLFVDQYIPFANFYIDLYCEFIVSRILRNSFFILLFFLHTLSTHSWAIVCSLYYSGTEWKPQFKVHTTTFLPVATPNIVSQLIDKFKEFAANVYINRNNNDNNGFL